MDAVEELRAAKEDLHRLKNEAYQAKERSNAKHKELEEARKRMFAAKDLVAREAEVATDA